LSEGLTRLVDRNPGEQFVLFPPELYREPTIVKLYVLERDRSILLNRTHNPATRCETHEERVAAVKSVVENAATNRAPAARYLDLNGAALAADEILAMIGIARGNDEPKAPR
jgi:hypothetical protein